jgi:hypothetical protein
MTSKQKYRELLELLEEVGVMQSEDDWAQQIQELIEQHREQANEQ